MRRLWRYLKRLLLGLLVLVLLLLSPIAYIETACRGSVAPSNYVSILPAEYQRAESRTYLTYPEWHIVHAYDDYAKVISTGDPHDYKYIQGITGFWTSLCALSQKSAEHGGFDWTTKQTIYTIGVSFTAELALKGLYEETLGRVATWIRGQDKSSLDRLSAQQAADYAKFLQQIPWYQWDFDRDITQLSAANSRSFRDRERQFALGIEFGFKSAYADVIKSAVASLGPDALTLRMIITDIPVETMEQYEDLLVISDENGQITIETPRYRVLTSLLQQLAVAGADFVEIAGNDGIMLSAISNNTQPDALFSFPRQGYLDQRHLISLKVADLAVWLRNNSNSPLRLEHIHDY